MMRPDALQQYIWQGIRKEVHEDRIELYLPFFFESHTDAPLCLTWNRDGVLSDGGRTIAELRKRVGNINPYMEKLRRILDERCPVELEAGHILVLKQYQTVNTPEEAYVDYLSGFSRMLRVISLISVIDTVEISWDGEVSV